MDDLAALSALELRDALARGDLSATEVTEYFLRQIDAHNERIGALSFIDADGALERARRCDREPLEERTNRPLLWGVPSADKDLSDRVGMPTGLGSASGGQYPSSSSPEVIALDRAGVLSLGKTATPEFGLYGYTSPAVGPIARHPLDPQLGAGGSSGGAAAAVAARMLPFAPGSDGGGSIRIPAASVGVVGFKPSRDLLPIDRGRGEVTGVVTGAIGRSVADSAVLLDALSQPLAGSTRMPEQTFLSATSEHARDTHGVRSVGFTLRSPWHDAYDLTLHPACEQAVATVLARLSGDSRVQLGDDVTFPSVAYAPLFQRAWQRAAAGIDARFDRARMEPVTQALIAAGDQLTAGEHQQNQASLRQFGDDLARRFEQYDIVLTPALANPWHCAEGWPSDAQENFDEQVRMAPYSSWVNVAGLPAITLPTPVTAASPCGALVPVSIQLIGRRGADRQLLSFASVVEALLTTAIAEQPR